MKTTPKAKKANPKERIIPNLLTAIGDKRVKQFRSEILQVWKDLLSGETEPVSYWERKNLENRPQPEWIADRHFDALIRGLAFKFPIGVYADDAPKIRVVDISLVRIASGWAEVEMPEIGADVAVKTKFREPYAIQFDGFYQFLGEFEGGTATINVVARWIPNPFWQYVSS